MVEKQFIRELQQLDRTFERTASMQKVRDIEHGGFLDVLRARVRDINAKGVGNLVVNRELAKKQLLTVLHKKGLLLRVQKRGRKELHRVHKLLKIVVKLGDQDRL